MKGKLSLKLVFGVCAVLIIATMSSCNRGYGCPYELEAAVNILTNLPR